MTIVDRFMTVFDLPAPLAGLTELAHNLWWTWDDEATTLFAGINPDRWHHVKHNPVALLADCDSRRLQALAQDAEFTARLDSCLARFRTQTALEEHPDLGDRTAAYFCAEFGIHESLPIYSGGLGILAGDHLKSASDLGLPLVAVGLAYRYGYFHQQIGPDGRQHEHYHVNEYGLLPAALQCDAAGTPITVAVPLPGRTVHVRIWKIPVGRIRLFLLDTDVDGNTDEDRLISGHLYGGNEDTRIRQEMVLGVGGLRALHALGIDPDVCHLNEGHSAFLAVEQLGLHHAATGAKIDDALEEIRERNVFTTHTPVAAGNDTFATDHVREYLRALTEGSGLDLDQLMALGHDRQNDPNNRFGMTVLALRASRFANGVSELHGRVARFMWRHLWPELDEDDVPIEHITNGVHMASWVAPELDRLYRGHLVDEGLTLADETIWRVHETLRRRLVDKVRARTAVQRLRHGAAPEELAAAATLLDPEALTIGFARRFAPYKRATLLLHRRERLAKLLNDPDRPMQILLAGKAHPQNEPGKQLMQEIWRISRDPIFQGRIVLLEGYNIALARHLVRGVDVWLNTPRRPLEASGTSGMKAAANGGLNLSVSDGWWCEGYQGDNGWSFGDAHDAMDAEQQDAADAEELFRILENKVVPAFYERGDDGVPHRWTAMMKAAVAAVIPQFSTARMVDEYAGRFYAPCANGEMSESEA